MRSSDNIPDPNHESEVPLSSQHLTRAAKIEKARKLVADPNYPSREVSLKLAQVLAARYLKGEL